MNAEAPRQLRRVVEAAPEDRFDMTVYGTPLSDEDGKDCGTACCAAGLAVLDPWFAGNTTIRDLFNVLRGPCGLGIEPKVYPATFPGLARIFGISREDADASFDADTVPAEKWRVLDDIDRILAGQPAIPCPEDEDE